MAYALRHKRTGQFYNPLVCTSRGVDDDPAVFLSTTPEVYLTMARAKIELVDIAIDRGFRVAGPENWDLVLQATPDFEIVEVEPS